MKLNKIGFTQRRKDAEVMRDSSLHLFFFASLRLCVRNLL
jgi:hypothetical protein